MRKRLFKMFAVCLLLAVAEASAESLTNYVNTCKQQLGFTSIPSNLNCYDGQLFAPSPGKQNLVNDYVGYSSINENVDAVFACRWLFGSKSSPRPAFSVELIVHNRQTGNTCFFASKDPPVMDPEGHAPGNTPANLTSPTDTSPSPTDASKTNADVYWKQPVEVDANEQCVDCHVAGPYIASFRIAPYLAMYGLLNNGHDTLTKFGQWDMPTIRYHAVGSTFSQWDSIAQTNAALNPNGCASACHAIAGNDPPSKFSLVASDLQVLIPSITIAKTDIAARNLMPANVYSHSDYRWANMDNPTNSGMGDNGDNETLLGLQQLYPNLACTHPTYLEARVVGSDAILASLDFPDKLHTFNLRDGLVCLNSEQPNGYQCHDYRVKYLCNGAWTNWYNTDAPTYDGDHEERSRDQNLCASPTAMYAEFNGNQANPQQPIWLGNYAPNDRLAEFDTGGLRCNNADQGSGNTCSNYVVRFICDGTNTTSLPQRSFSILRTQHLDRNKQYTYLTASTSKADDGINNQYYHVGWASQQWIAEPVTDFSALPSIPVSDRPNAIRLKNAWSGYYMTSNDINKGPNAQYPLFWVLDQALRTNWSTQVWIKEADLVHGYVRYRTAWVPSSNISAVSKLYLTLNNGKNGDKDVQDVYVQPLGWNSDGSSWDTQHWVIQ